MLRFWRVLAATFSVIATHPKTYELRNRAINVGSSKY